MKGRWWMSSCFHHVSFVLPPSSLPFSLGSHFQKLYHHQMYWVGRKIFHQSRSKSYWSYSFLLKYPKLIYEHPQSRLLVWCRCSRTYLHSRSFLASYHSLPKIYPCQWPNQEHFSTLLWLLCFSLTCSGPLDLPVALSSVSTPKNRSLCLIQNLIL